MSKKILIVDDSRVSRMMIKSIVVEKYPDWEIKEAGDGQQAIDIAKTESFDYFSIDINMPNKNGFEVIENLKPIYPDSRYSLLTANIQQATKDRADSLGAALVNKPITEDSVNEMLAYFVE